MTPKEKMVNEIKESFKNAGWFFDSETIIRVEMRLKRLTKKQKPERIKKLWLGKMF